jgi:hypothetical protein
MQACRLDNGTLGVGCNAPVDTGSHFVSHAVYKFLFLGRTDSVYCRILSL